MTSTTLGHARRDRALQQRLQELGHVEFLHAWARRLHA